MTSLFASFIVLGATWLIGAPQAPTAAAVELFTPQGTVKGVRQVQVRFSEAMVPFGDPRLATTPFDVSCPRQGTGRWVDSRNWVYDFAEDLPAGVNCAFVVKTGLKSLAGREIEGPRRFSFSTGGPAIIESRPWEGGLVAEDQIFILDLDAEASEESVLKHVWFDVEGVYERVGVRIVSGDERAAILKAAHDTDPPPGGAHFLIQARRRFPNEKQVSLLWGKGVVSKSGVATEQDQILPFKTRSAFTAEFGCTRENERADCVPLTPMRLYFASPIPWEKAKQAILTGMDGKKWAAQSGEAEEEGEERFVQSIQFRGPFPEKSEFRLELPAGIQDDAGRPLQNADRFPLVVRTDHYPPLAKFSGHFGILEWKASPILPVTVRNLEAELAGRTLETGKGEAGPGPGEQLPGRILKAPSNQIAQILFWIERVRQRDWEQRGVSIFEGVDTGAVAPRSFSIPKPNGPEAFEVMGIPLKTPGFYVVELESEVLGAALLGRPGPMFVQTTALVTNLSVHFKWGVESSLVWVTSLDQGKPTPGCLVAVHDCTGKMLWSGQTDAKGTARVTGLPALASIPTCRQPSTDSSSYRPSIEGLVVTARLAEDMAFVQTGWNDGIEPWRFNLPTEYDHSLVAAKSVLDRSLLRAGETLHMKHFVRRHVTSGFAAVPESERPAQLVISHYGSDQTYEMPLSWDSAGVAETEWKIPKEAKLGLYSVSLRKSKTGDEYPPQWTSAEFRVEEYRVPLLKGSLQFPTTPLVQPASTTADLNIQYLAGGGAGSLPVRLRYQVAPWYAALPGLQETFEEFVFGSAPVKEGVDRGEDGERAETPPELKRLDLTLDRTGCARVTLSNLPSAAQLSGLRAELDFRDPNGETQTISSSVPLWPSEILAGLKTEHWMSVKSDLKFDAAAADLQGKPAAGKAMKVQLFERKSYSHRKRLVGGFYAYEHFSETRSLGVVCQGQTDSRGLFPCQLKAPKSGNLILQAVAVDSAGRESYAVQEVWVGGEERWWFPVEDHDRMDLIPERKHYEPGETARFQVRMPFERATALITVEREGVGEVFVRELSGKSPVVDLPVQGHHAPNIYVSVLAVRGRVSDVKPTALVDLGRPAYKLGVARIDVGWRAHELKVRVAADRSVYKAREKAAVKIGVTTALGTALPPGSEIALAAVDEGLLELMPNSTWQLLDSMMGQRSCGVATSTAQMHVVGKRHFGLKALPQGGGGGKQATRELFDTLLIWKSRVPLDAQGNAEVEVPLNDSITSFRIVAVATAGLGLFGTGSTSIRTAQDLALFSGLAPVVREEDRFRALFTVRNASDRNLAIEVSGRVRELRTPFQPVSLQLAAGEAREVSWEVAAPVGVETLRYEIEARSADASDRIAVRQRVVEAVPVRVFQATISQLETEQQMTVERPVDALAGRGGVNVLLRPTLTTGLGGVTRYMRRYPYTCLEQKVSRAIALRDQALWESVMNDLPSYLDSDGLAKYFPSCATGSDTLTSYVLAIAQEAGWEIPTASLEKMEEGLRGFAEGRVIRWGALPTMDLAIRKVAAVEALSRYGAASPELLESISIEPNLWPTSAVIDWCNLVQRLTNLPRRRDRMVEAGQILRSRLNLQGTVMSFSTEGSDSLWWLMISNDVNAVRMLLSAVNFGLWREDIPRLVRGALARQKGGHWDLTVANAWGVLAVEKFAQAFEKTPVSGVSTAALAGPPRSVDWKTSAGGDSLLFAWPSKAGQLAIRHAGEGKPWVTVQSLAAIPLKQPFSSGYKIVKTVTAVERAQPDRWSRGDIVRVRLELEAQADMTWVVVSDPVPGGAAVLGSGLGRDSSLATGDERSEGWVWPAFEERSFEAYRAYYEYVPKGAWVVEYTLRLNNPGDFRLPPTRVEALYSPEMLGEVPNQSISVK